MTMTTMNVAEGSVGQLATDIAEVRGTKLLMIELGEVEEGVPGVGEVGLAGMEGPLELLVAMVLGMSAVDHIFREAVEVLGDDPAVVQMAGMVAGALALLTTGTAAPQIMSAHSVEGILQ